MAKRAILWLAVWALALTASAGAAEYEYAAGTRYEAPITVGADEVVTLDIGYGTAALPATQAGDITSANDNGTLVVIGRGGGLILAGDNRGYIGKVEHVSGTLLFAEDQNLFGRLAGYAFRGRATKNSAIATAIGEYADDPTSENWQAMQDAIDAAREDAVLPTFAVADGSGLVIDGRGAADQWVEVAAGAAGSFHVAPGATLTFANIVHNVVEGFAFGGALSVGADAVLALTAEADGAFAFVGNKATSSGDGGGYGGAIDNWGTLTLTNASFTGNTAGNSGGAINNYGGTLTLTNASFTGNTAGDSGGAIYNTGTLTLTNASFTGNTADNTGGAIHNTGTLTLTNASFTGNTAGYSGGAIHNTGALTLTNASFTGNSAQRGGAIFNYKGTLTLTNASFTGNSAQNGGAIFNDSGPLTLTLTNASFTGNTADGSGGAIDNYYGALTLTNASFTGNTAGSDGGAVRSVEDGSIGIVVDAGETSLFSGNRDRGGANSIYMYLSDGGSLDLTINNAGTLDMRDPLCGNIINDPGAIAVTKTGSGEWRLGGANDFTLHPSSVVTFTISEGTLHLYREGEVANANPDAPDAMVAAGSIKLEDGSFTLAGGASLSVGGGAWVGGATSAPNTIAADTIRIGDGAVLRFDLANHDGTDPDKAMLTLTVTSTWPG